MAYNIPVFMFSLEAAADLSAKQYHFVKVDANGRAAICTSLDDLPVGVLQNDPSALGQEATIMALGITKVVADAALTIGNQVGTSADGQADAKTVGTDTTQYVCGVVLEATTQASELATITISTLAPHRGAGA